MMYLLFCMLLLEINYYYIDPLFRRPTAKNMYNNLTFKAKNGWILFAIIQPVNDKVFM